MTFFFLFFGLAVFTSMTQEWLRSKRQVRRPLHLLHVQPGGITSDFVTIQIHAESQLLVCNPMSPARRWYPCGDVDQKKAYVLGSSEKDLPRKHQN